ncbi:MAG: metal ABC transporter ATP-binding protein [Rhodobacteraceae bacterium]|nr:metal ABC transporter ATP-binding protein [Paracoccaceae bacterium]
MSPLISVKNLAVRQGKRELLHDINFDLVPGEAVSLIGPNGAGKTTLIRAMIGVIKPTTGSIQRRAGLRLGYTPQKLHLEQLMPMRVDRFLALSGEKACTKRDAMLDRCDALRLNNTRMTDLSGGELQRVLLARAMIRKPDLLILDEPTQGLDQSGEARFYALLNEIRAESGVSVFMVSHDLHVVMAESDRVICLNTHICCSGAPEQVSEDPSYHELFGARAGLAIYQHHHSHSEDCNHD